MTKLDKKLTPLERDFIELWRSWKHARDLYDRLPIEIRVGVNPPGKEPIMYKGKVFL